MNTMFELKVIILKQYETQKKFAKAMGCSELDVSQVIHNRRKLDRAEQARWAQVLNTKRERLFGRDLIS